MHSSARSLSRVAVLAAAFMVAGCSRPPSGLMIVPRGDSARADGRAERPEVTSSPIHHIVVLIQENRSFDNLFATFPGADGATSGERHNGKIVPLVKHALVSLDVEHNYNTFLADYDNGKMERIR